LNRGTEIRAIRLGEFDDETCVTIAIAFFASCPEDPGWGAKIDDNT
jgi:hypothetical protein